MNVEEVRQICIAKKGVTEGFPFDETTLVIKVGGKIFALISLDRLPSVNLKCDPERAIDLRERFSDITPGYHMNKKHWNTVIVEGTLSKKQIFDMVDDSYKLVNKVKKQAIKNFPGEGI